MSVLPTNTLLGKLEIIEIYEHYDQPLLFACRNASDNLYLVVLEDEEDEFENWLYASMSPARFAQVRSGGIDLYNAFKNAEDGFVFLVKLYRDRQIPSVITKVPTDQLQDEQLPESGEALNLETATLEKKEISVQRRAAQLYREYVEMALEFPGQRRTEAPISVLSDIMRYLQDTLISIGHTISDFHKDSKSPTRDLVEKMELALLDVSAGSFKLEMASIEQSDMFGDTLLGDALQELARIIAIGSNEEELQSAFTELKSSVPKDYLKLLKSIRNSRIDRANLRWASANGQRVGESVLTSPTVISTIDTIEQMVVTETNFIRVTGKLTGAFTDREFEVETRDQVYRGRLDNQALTVEASDIINNAQLGKRYILQLRQVVTRKIATDETTTKYFLVDVEEDQL
ncbi:hypothetical protein FBR06_10570 [Betaproteobacteria bacterium PRO4]|nr:hypothetical protein [Chloroflexota bacterium]MDL1867652.1 hypothetical protein [Betaproteobacteria bacterium PRO4]